MAALATPAAPTPVLKGTNQPAISIQAFGEPAVFLDERPITRWRMARAMELFFFLLDAGRPMRKEQIITALWPQVDDQINQTFHSTIHRLRKALNDTYVISRGGTYGLDLPSSDGNRFHYDVAQFKDLHVNEREGKDLKLHVINDAAQEKQLELVREWSSLFRLCLCQTLPRKRKRLLHSYKWRASQWELSLHPDADRSRPGWTECLPLPHKRADAVHQRDVFAFSTPSVNSTRRHHQGSWHR